MTKFFSILTKAGEAAFAAASITGIAVKFTQMAIGDGGGSTAPPSTDQTGLVNELYRAPLNRLVIADQSANVIRAEMIMPPQIGGFWIREAALFDDEGVCLVLANVPESYKPLLEDGAGRMTAVNIWTAISSTKDVQLKADPSVIVATISEVNQARNEAKDYADEQLGEHENSRAHPDATLTERGFTRLNNSIDSNDESTAATPKAVKAAYDLAASKAAFDIIYPVGIVTWLAANKNPNTLWPGTTWAYLGENKTIRLAKQDGSDVKQVGGADTVTLAGANIPAHAHQFSATTSPFDYGTKQTTDSGNHNHQGGWGAPGTKWDVIWTGTDNQGPHDRNLTGDAGNHSHTVSIGSHSHSVSGTTENTGSGTPFSIVNSYIKLMGWYRIA